MPNIDYDAIDAQVLGTFKQVDYDVLDKQFATPPAKAHGVMDQITGPLETFTNTMAHAWPRMQEGVNSALAGVARKVADPGALWDSAKSTFSPTASVMPFHATLPPVGNVVTDKIDSMLRESNRGTHSQDVWIDKNAPAYVPTSSDNWASRKANQLAGFAGGMAPLLAGPEMAPVTFGTDILGGAAQRAEAGGATPEQQGNIALHALPAAVVAATFPKIGKSVGATLEDLAGSVERSGWNRAASVIGSKPVGTGVTGVIVGPTVATLGNMAQGTESLPHPTPNESPAKAALSWGLGGAAMDVGTNLLTGKGLGLRPASAPAPEGPSVEDTVYVEPTAEPVVASTTPTGGQTNAIQEQSATEVGATPRRGRRPSAGPRAWRSGTAPARGNNSRRRWGSASSRGWRSTRRDSSRCRCAREPRSPRVRRTLTRRRARRPRAVEREDRGPASPHGGRGQRGPRGNRRGPLQGGQRLSQAVPHGHQGRCLGQSGPDDRPQGATLGACDDRDEHREIMGIDEEVATTRSGLCYHHGVVQAVHDYFGRVL